MEPHLRESVTILYIYNAGKSNQIMTERNITELNRDKRICSFDIENKYTNIPWKDIINTINDVLDNNTEI
jgi:hypothetical protein